MQKPVSFLGVAGILAISLGACSAKAPPPAAAPDIPVVKEAFLSVMTPEHNIDSPAAWSTPGNGLWVIATAKETDQLIVYDGDTGGTLREVGASGTGPGEFKRPNGVFVIDDVLFVVERDNRRVQLLRLPGFESLAVFGAEHLLKPYGLWVRAVEDGYDLYVTDAYEQPDESVPPLEELDRRVKRFKVSAADGRYSGTFVGAFGDTGAEGALRVVESIWGDPAHDRLLIAEEDESYANEIKVYTLEGAYAGTVFGRDIFAAQAEGISLYACADGTGYWLTTEQGPARTVFHVFDRRNLSHVGAFAGESVANTDGIWLQQTASTPRFPAGALYAVHDDQGIVAFDWRDVARALGLSAHCATDGHS